MSTPDTITPIVDILLKLYLEQKIEYFIIKCRPIIDCRFHMSRMADAQIYLRERRNVGNIILVWDESMAIIEFYCSNTEFH